MGNIDYKFIYRRLSGGFLAVFLAFILISTLTLKIKADTFAHTTNWQDIRDQFSQMQPRQKLAVIIAANARSENRHTFEVSRAYKRNQKVNRLMEVKHFLEKTKLLRELSHYINRPNLRQTFTAEIRAIKSYLRGEMTRIDLDQQRELTNHRIKDILLAIKNKGLFMDQVQKSKHEISLIGDAIYLMAKARRLYTVSDLH